MLAIYYRLYYRRAGWDLARSRVFSQRQKIRPRERVYPYDIIVHNGGLEQY